MPKEEVLKMVAYVPASKVVAFIRGAPEGVLLDLAPVSAGEAVVGTPTSPVGETDWPRGRVYGYRDKRSAAGLLRPQVAEHLDKIAPRPPRAYANGRRFKGISGPDLILRTLRSRKTRRVGYARLQAIFAKHGFAGTSWRAAVSKLVSSGTIKRDGHGIVLVEIARRSMSKLRR